MVAINTGRLNKADRCRCKKLLNCMVAANMNAVYRRYARFPCLCGSEFDLREIELAPAQTREPGVPPVNSVHIGRYHTVEQFLAPASVGLVQSASVDSHHSRGLRRESHQ